MRFHPCTSGCNSTESFPTTTLIYVTEAALGVGLSIHSQLKCCNSTYL
ncbi:hypothetical protein H5410_034396 [Solanum commersonii]|uniref:Uncharacterized protein n=1 Tax=Solanum commersonii TaxID=4109 RepID=A0A9J5YRI7_SOLCO|nr:hypothetical protein H5410_034396 [Solanum commersonii]